ncbi:GIY-YIG nuclease family protein [Marinicella rhabdoformis]|uniref:GIY-YIG nuclease family protein n=1 Tax=Marinicella rhabdoformis TaxID=2580566 RepID=UPI0012AEB7EF|nr:GIY-YIG nuclease family protein [Marinicella rhabdoformis]
MKPQTIQIFLPEGSPTSVKEAELTNRLINTIWFPRTAMDKAAKREISQYTGVYFLFGDGHQGKPQVYIGEGENCWMRLRLHNRNKDFWTHCVICVAKTNEFTKTDVKFLEHYCLDKALKAGRYATDNGTGSLEPSVSESRKYDLLDHFDTIKILLATLGYPLFEDKRGDKAQQRKVFFCKGKQAEAKCIVTDEGYLVLAGSTANIENTKTIGTGPKALRAELIEKEVLVQKGDVFEFTSDQLFKSPSAASSSVLGRSSNGWAEWKDKSGKTMDTLLRQ